MAVPIETYRTILNLHNPRANAETCPGHSTPRNRRCAIPLGPENQAQVNNVLGLIRDTPADIPALVALVANLTQALLCRHHLLQDRHRVGMALIEAFMEQKWLEEDEDEDEDEEEEEQEEEYELADLEDVVLPRPVLPRPPVNSNQGVYVGGSFFNRWTKFCPMDRTEMSWNELVMA
ncbi:hypothetical protein LTR09_010252 [Extremus antarcticus]|uniref:Uncharacterized protein n=1 Tax=Extremus antarcticus TaxID=702011 RepID=A0AAJ0DEB1_9PEZI|nr:hypothetical protein LTR09_010252 [Extremus antarcticus]